MKKLTLLSLFLFVTTIIGAEGGDFVFNEETRTRQNLMLVAMGKEKADLIIAHVTMLEVHTLTWQKNWDIVIKGKRIAWTGPSGEWTGEAKKIVDAKGLHAVPGFGESHKHIESSHVTPEFEAALVIPFGNTWTVEGSHEFSNVSGEHNVEFWLTPRKHGSPLKIFPELGSATPPTPYETGGGYYGYAEVRENMASHPWVIGLGEVMDWPRVWNTKLEGSDRIWEVMQAARDANGVIEGHGSGLIELGDINAFAAAGLESEHEVWFAEEAWNKINRGIFLQLRYYVLPMVFPYFKEKGIKDWSHISITTDDRNAAEALEIGTTDHNLRLAIKSGAPMEAAYAMASLYPARHAGIDHLVGSLAPGRFADVVLLENPETVDIKQVYADGILAAENGKYLLDPPKIDWPQWARQTINLPRQLKAEDFHIPAPEGRKTVQAAILKPFHFENDYMTETLSVKNGLVLPDAEKQITKLALIDRYTGEGKIGKMFWKTVGPKTPRSAVACSVSHDLHNLWVIGNDDAAMALAINEIAAMGGGWALVNDGVITARVRYEIGGLMSARPPQEVAQELNNLYAAADEMEWIGEPGLPRRMIFAFLTCTPWKWCLVAPFEGAPEGFINVVTGATHPIVW